MTSEPRTTYLAGAIEYAADGGIAWRREIAEWLDHELGHKVHDPTEHDFQQLTDEEKENLRIWKETNLPRFRQAIRKIIHHDLRLLLEHTDYVICRWCPGTSKGGGTHGELTMAYWHQIPVYLLLDAPRSEVSSWILGCATAVFENWDDLKAELKQLYDTPSEGTT
ncbi:hypothetical protein KQI84_06565 [bacterium]|nr:hypothetical protein [bacterium]